VGARLDRLGSSSKRLTGTRWFGLGAARALARSLRHADVEAIQIGGRAALRCVG